MGVLPYIPVAQKQVTGGSGGRGKRGLWGEGVGWMGVVLVLREQAGQEGPQAPGQSPTGQPLWHFCLPTSEHMFKDKLNAQQTLLKVLLRKSYYFF